MSERYTPDEISAGCPVVLLAHEADMRERQHDTYASMLQDETLHTVVGYMLNDGVPEIVVSPQSRFRSHRQLTMNESDDDRITTPTAAQLHLIKDGLTVLYPNILERSQSLVGKIIAGSYGLMTSTGEVNQFVIYQTYPPEVPLVTRGGFLGEKRGDTTAPLLTLVGGQHYAVELKGCGNATGELDIRNDKFLGKIVIGGLPYADAWKEARVLAAAHEAGLTPVVPLAYGMLDSEEAHSGEYGELGIVYRLTPSTVRLSHQGTSHSVPFETPEDTQVMASKMAANFLQKFLRQDDAPIFISPASHLENYLVTDSLTTSETDFEDFLDFGSEDFPFIHQQTGSFVSSRLAVSHYFMNISRLPGYDEAVHTRVLAASIERRLAAAGIIVNLDDCTLASEIGGQLWDQWLVDVEYGVRKKDGYVPHSIHSFFKDNFTKVTELGETHTGPAIDDFRRELELLLDDPDIPEKLKTAAKNYSYIMTAFTVPGIKNSNREEAIRSIRNSAAISFQASGITDPSEVPEQVLALVEFSLGFHEFAARLYGGIRYLKKWVESELHNANLLVKTNNKELEPAVDMLQSANELIGYILESDDYSEAVGFFRDQMPLLVRMVGDIIRR